MNPTQKRFLEWPLLLFIWFVIGALEMSVLQLPFGMGAPQIVPILIAYFCLTRNWFQLTFLTIIFAILSSGHIGFPTGVYVAGLLWAALITKIFVMGFTLEGRRAFVALVAIFHIFWQELTWLMLKSLNMAPLFRVMFWKLPGIVLIVGVLAWFLFPLFIRWDEYFDHAIDDSRELNPNVLK